MALVAKILPKQPDSIASNTTLRPFLNFSLHFEESEFFLHYSTLVLPGQHTPRLRPHRTGVPRKSPNRGPRRREPPWASVTVTGLGPSATLDDDGRSPQAIIVDGPAGPAPTRHQ